MRKIGNNNGDVFKGTVAGTVMLPYISDLAHLTSAAVTRRGVGDIVKANSSEPRGRRFLSLFRKRERREKDYCRGEVRRLFLPISLKDLRMFFSSTS